MLTEAMAISDPRTQVAYGGQGDFINKNLNSAYVFTTQRAIFKTRINSKSGLFTGAMCMFQSRSTNTQKQKPL